MPAAVAPLQHLHRLAIRASLGSASDRELIERFNANRDADVFAALVERHGPMVLNLCRRLTGDSHTTEDAFQATFLALARSIHAIRRPESLPSWLYGTARRFALRLRRGAARRSATALDVPAAERDPLEEVSARELLCILDEELARLAESYRIPILLCAIEGLTVAEAAERIGVPPATVRGRLERGRAKLHARLVRRGLSLPAALTALLAVPRVAPSAALCEATVHLLTVSVLPPEVAALTSPAGFTLKFKLAGVALLMVGIVGFGTAVLPERGPARSAAAREQKSPPERAARDVATKSEVDPTLGPAVRRFGTLSMRGCRGPVAFSPDGKHVACAGGDSGANVIIWERSTGKKVRTFESRATLSELLFSQVGKRLAAIANGWNVNSVWEVATGRKLLEFSGSAAAFSSDGKLVFVLAPAALETHDLDKGKVLKSVSLPPRGDFVGRSAIRPDGSLLVRGDGVPDPKMPNSSSRAELSFYDADGTLIGTVPMKALCQGLTFSPDGKRLAAADRLGVYVFDAETRKEVASWPQRSDTAPAFSADGKRVSWVGYDTTEHQGMSAYVAEIGGRHRRVGPGLNRAVAPAFGPDGKTLALIDDGNTLLLRDVATGSDIAPTDGHTGQVYGATFTSDGRHLITRDKNRLLVWERATGKLLRRYPDDLPAKDVLSPYGQTATHLLVYRDSDKSLRMIETVSGHELLRLDCKLGVGWAPNVPPAIAADGSAAAIVGRDHHVRVYDLPTGKQRCDYYPKVAINSIALSVDGRLLAGYSPEPKRGHFLINAVSGDEVDPSKQSGPLPRVSELPDGRRIGSGVESFAWLKRQKLLGADGQPFKLDWQWVGHTVYLSPDGRLLAARYQEPNRGESEQTTARFYLWETATGRALSHFNPQLAGGTMAAFSPDGRSFVTTAYDGSIRLWEVATGQLRLTLRGHLPGEITTLAFSPDSRGLVSGGSDTQVLLWDVTGRAPDGIWCESRLSADRQRELWGELAGQDAAKAHRAVWGFAADPAGTVKFLDEQIQPVKAADPQRLAGLIAGLDDAAFAVREKASNELAHLCEAALPALRVALAKPASAEQEQQLKKLLEPYKSSAPSGERLRQVRAVEVLEQLSAPQAMKLLQKWAGGIADALLTHEAKAALSRR